VSNDGYVFRYVRPTAAVNAERVSFGAVIMVTRHGKQVTRLHTMQSFYPSTNANDGFIGRFFDSGNADSTIGLDAGPLHDIWTVAAANLSQLAPLMARDERILEKEYNTIVTQIRKQIPLAKQQMALNATLNKFGFWVQRDQAVQGIASQYLKHTYPIQFLLIVSPLVTWIWTGAAIVFLGGLTALIPPGLLGRRRIPAQQQAPVAVRELA
jgi:hypothetical protein